MKEKGKQAEEENKKGGKTIQVVARGPGTGKLKRQYWGGKEEEEQEEEEREFRKKNKSKIRQLLLGGGPFG